MKYYLVEVQSDDEDSTDAESKKPPRKYIDKFTFISNAW